MTASRKTALITGASSGIGEALAVICARHSYDLILVARNPINLEVLAGQLRQQYDASVAVRPCDLSTPGNVQQLCEALLAEGRQVDMLINNAGALEHGAFTALSADDHQRIVQLNVSALTNMLAYLLPTMVKRGSGKVMNIASLGAFQPLPSVATYAATKAFVLSLSEALTEELKGSGVTLTVVCPGLTATNMMVTAQQKSQTLHKIPKVLIGDATTVAQKAFDATLAGKPLIVPGVKNNLVSVLSRATPKWLVRFITGIAGRAILRRG